jgi:hypothetical protein
MSGVIVFIVSSLDGFRGCSWSSRPPVKPVRRQGQVRSKTEEKSTGVEKNCIFTRTGVSCRDAAEMENATQERQRRRSIAAWP